MTKSEIVASVAKETGLTQVAVEEVMTLALMQVQAAIVAGDRVIIHGFGIFKPAKRAAMTINSRLAGGGQLAEKATPKTIPACKVVKFKAAPPFNEAMNPNS